MADKKNNAPVCSSCGATGHGATFLIFSTFGFGKYCVDCEKKAHAAMEVKR